MASENAHIDDNSRNTLTALANDGSGDIYNARVNPTTRAWIVEGDLISTNTQIGSTIPGGTAGSVLFLGPGGTLDQDNADFYYNPVAHFLGLGTDLPAATLHVVGSIEFDLGGDATGDMYYRDSSGQLVPLAIGTQGQVLEVNAGVPAWVNSSVSGSGYVTIESNGTPLTARDTMNFSTLFAVTDSASPARTNIDINVANLAANSTFVTDLVANTTFTNDLANNANFYSTLAGNSSFISALTSNSTFQSGIVNIVNTSGSISINLATQVTGLLNGSNINQGSLSLGSIGGTLNLATQVSGVLPVTHGGTGQSSLTAYAPLFGGTSGTGNVQSGTVGTAGQVLTSNGASSLPTFQSVPGTGYFVTSGQASTLSNTGSVTISHTLGVAPKYVKIHATSYSSAAGAVTANASYGVYDVLGNAYNTVYSNTNSTTTVLESQDQNGFIHGTVTSVSSTQVVISLTSSSSTVRCGYVAELVA